MWETVAIIWNFLHYIIINTKCSQKSEWLSPCSLVPVDHITSFWFMVGSLEISVKVHFKWFRVKLSIYQCYFWINLLLHITKYVLGKHTEQSLCTKCRESTTYDNWGSTFFDLLMLQKQYAFSRHYYLDFWIWILFQASHMHHDIPYDAGQWQTTFSTRLRNHQGKQECALQGTILTAFGEYENLGNYMR